MSVRALQRRMRVNFARVGAMMRFYAHGTLLYVDIKRRLGQEQMRTIFDIGGNVGQSVEELSVVYPHARIFTFEPDPTTFAKLKSNVSKTENARPFNLAFGSARGSARFDNSHPRSVMHQIAANQANDRFPFVTVETIDHFCAENDIPSVDYLKIDTEGNDLEVLRGATQMLAGHSISIIVAECSMNRDNQRHVQFWNLHSFMEDCDYRLFGIYQQVREGPTKKPNLRRANVAYLSPKVIARN